MTSPTPQTPPTLTECQEVINLLLRCVQYHVSAEDKIAAYIKAADLITRIEDAEGQSADATEAAAMDWPY